MVRRRLLLAGPLFRYVALMTRWNHAYTHVFTLQHYVYSFSHRSLLVTSICVLLTFLFIAVRTLCLFGLNREPNL